MSVMTVRDLQSALIRINPEAKVTLITPYGYPIFLDGIARANASAAETGSIALFGQIEAKPDAPEWRTPPEPNALWRRLNRELNRLGDDTEVGRLHDRPALTLVQDNGVYHDPEKA